VTIAVGLATNDGIVLCADTQYTISGYIKTYDGKVDLHVFPGPHVALAIAVSGTDEYIQTAKQALLKDFPENLDTFDAVHDLLKERWLRFFDDHIARWAYFPERDRPSVDLLIAVSGYKVRSALFHCTGTAFYETRQKAIGDGILLANELINRHCYDGVYPVAQLGSLAIYIVGKVKNGVDGCGGSTDVMAVRKGCDFALTNHNQVQQLEKEFLALEKSYGGDALTKAIIAKPLHLSWQSEHRKKLNEREKVD
jgi:hypothetical protein